MITHLPHRFVIRISGEDANSFLQGLITQDIQLLASQPIIFSAMLSAQGKHQHDFFIIPQDDALLIDIDMSHKETFMKKLRMYKLRSKVSIEETDLQVCAAWAEQPADETAWLADPRLPGLGWRRISSHRGDDNSAAYNAHRLGLAIPDGMADATDRHFALELGYDQLNGVSFNKGCFIGQEPTARMHYRHVLRKCLYKVQSSQPLPPAGSAITAGGKTLGEMRSSAGNIGLAFCRIEPVQNATAPILAEQTPVQLQLPNYMQNKLDAIAKANSQ